MDTWNVIRGDRLIPQMLAGNYAVSLTADEANAWTKYVRRRGQYIAYVCSLARERRAIAQGTEQEVTDATLDLLEHEKTIYGIAKGWVRDELPKLRAKPTDWTPLAPIPAAEPDKPIDLSETPIPQADLDEAERIVMRWGNAHAILAPNLRPLIDTVASALRAERIRGIELGCNARPTPEMVERIAAGLAKDCGVCE